MCKMLTDDENQSNTTSNSYTINIQNYSDTFTRFYIKSGPE